MAEVISNSKLNKIKVINEQKYILNIITKNKPLE